MRRWPWRRVSSRVTIPFVSTVVSAEAGAPAARLWVCDRLTVVLVRPTRYDDDGYVVRHWLGTLPSNTLSCLNGLTLDAVESGALGSLPVDVLPFDECVDRIYPRRIVRRLRRPGTRILVALAGVQTNQFPRAPDRQGSGRAGMQGVWGKQARHAVGPSVRVPHRRL